MKEIRFYVNGEPRTQGSKRPCPIYRGKRGEPRVFTGQVVMMEGATPEATAKFKRWREDVKIAAFNEKNRKGLHALDEPVVLIATFYLPKPGKPMFDVPATSPDLDKLCRSVGDSLKDAGVITEDGRITDIHIRKRFVDGLHAMGADIHVRTLAVEDLK